MGYITFSGKGNLGRGPRVRNAVHREAYWCFLWMTIVSHTLPHIYQWPGKEHLQPAPSFNFWFQSCGIRPAEVHEDLEPGYVSETFQWTKLCQGLISSESQMTGPLYADIIIPLGPCCLVSKNVNCLERVQYLINKVAYVQRHNKHNVRLLELGLFLLICQHARNEPPEDRKGFSGIKVENCRPLCIWWYISRCRETCLGAWSSFIETFCNPSEIMDFAWKQKKDQLRLYGVSERLT